MPLIARLGAGLGVIVLFAAAYFLVGTGSVSVQLDLPITGEEGFLVEVSAVYVRDGRRETVPLVEKLISGDDVIEVTVPFAIPWQFESLLTRVRHPFYRPINSYAFANPHWRNTSVIVAPELWSRSHDYYIVSPKEETTIEGLEHLRWLREEYADRVPPHIFVQEIRRAQLMLGSLAFARGEKESGWEQSRRVAMSELESINELLDAKTYQPCPEGYEHDPTVPIICGRRRGDTIWPE